MSRILIIYYSQSGEVARVAKLLGEELSASGAETTFAAIRPEADYPYPWRSVRRFFDAMPESVLGLPPEIRAPAFDPNARFDLVILVYPVWFLSPALPIQGFFKSSHAAVLRDTEVIAVSVSRAMWQQASLAMKELLRRAGAIHCDSIAATHQGSPLATLISTPRTLLSGKRDRLMGVFPQAGVAEGDLARIGRLGLVVAEKLGKPRSQGSSFLRGEPAIAVKRWLVVPELLAWYFFHAWAVIARQLGKLHPGLRAVAVYGFALFLVALILVGLPLAVLGTFLFYPLIGRWLDAYVARMAAPTGEARRKA